MRATERAELLDAIFSSFVALPNDRLANKFVKTAAFWGRLTIDVTRHWASAETSSSERRAFVRAAFAALDAFLSQGSNFLLFLHERGWYGLTAAQVALLQEKRPEVDAQGEIIFRDSFVPFPKKLRLLLNLAGQYSFACYKVDVGDSGWQSLRAAIEKRDRLTHPKKLEHLEVRDEDVQDLKHGLKWLFSQLVLTALLNCFTPMFRRMHQQYPLESATNADLRQYLLQMVPTQPHVQPNDLRELQQIKQLGGFASEAYILTVVKECTEALCKKLRSSHPDDKFRQFGTFMRKAI